MRELNPVKIKKVEYSSSLEQALSAMNMPHPNVNIKSAKGVKRIGSIRGITHYGNGGRYSIIYRNGRFEFIDHLATRFGYWVEKVPTQILSMADHKKTLGDVCTNL
jgi:hypothetical protein